MGESQSCLLEVPESPGGPVMTTDSEASPTSVNLTLLGRTLESLCLAPVTPGCSTVSRNREKAK